MTNDDELTRRLRSTLHGYAEGLDPTPGEFPSAPLSLRPQRPPRKRWVVPVAGAAAVAAAAGIVAGVLVSTDHGTTRTGAGPAAPDVTVPSSSAPTPSATPTTSPRTVSPATSPSTPPTTGRPITTPVSFPMPTGFKAASVTFISTYTGWATGTYPCGSSACVAIGRTIDGGTTWARVISAPKITFSGSSATNMQANDSTLEIRFADASDGWIVNTPGEGQTSQLWSTHDGGQTWHEVHLPTQGTIEELEASGGQAQLVSLTTNSYRIYSTPVGSDDWTASPLHPEVGAGPVPSSQLVLNGTSGWIIDNDRTVVGGAILEPNGWSAWTPPCRSANGTGIMAAATSSDLYAFCEEGIWGPPPPGLTPGSWLYRSTNGGSSWTAVGFHQDASLSSLSAAPNGTLLQLDSDHLALSVNGGHTWTPVYYGNVSYIGYTTDSQAVAITGTGQVLMSHDGGQTWAQVKL